MRERNRTKIWCAEIDCEHLKDNRCTAKEINLSAGFVNTLYEGRMRCWKCGSFKLSEQAKEMQERVEEYMKQIKAL